jgi:initiation factor 1A
MVKNQDGGNKSKRTARKLVTGPVDRKVRLAYEEGEIYAVVTKMLGNGMFHANDPEGKERLCVMRNKFRGRGKRDNIVTLGCWVLIGEREFESSSSKPKCDLLEVYTDVEKMKLKKTGNPIFDKLKSEHDNKIDETNTDNISFESGDTEKYKELLESIEASDHKNENKKPIETINMDGDQVDIDDI